MTFSFPHPLRWAPRLRRERRTLHLDALARRADVAVRRALEGDAVTLKRLAELDSAPPLPPGEHLVAEVDGRVVAALDERTGRVVSDPFVPTASAVELLVLHDRHPDSWR